MYFKLIAKNSGAETILPASVNAEGRLVLRPSDVPADTEFIEFHHDYFTARVGDDGWFLAPSYYSTASAVTCSFIYREPDEKVITDCSMPFFASCKARRLLMAMVEGMDYEFDLVAGIRGDDYYMYPRFKLECGFYEDIAIRLVEFNGDDATPAALARYYRDTVLLPKCRPLRERLKDQPVLAKALQGPKVRIRMGWKPFPPEVTEQDRSMPQPVHCAITFDRVRDIVDAFKNAGIDHAEFCLVGWNLGGHDGQYPDLLPVEPSAGGEGALRALLQYASTQGYLVGAHTNNHDTYSAASTFKMEDMQRDKSGNVMLGGKWCGGQSRLICPKVANDTYLARDMAILKDLGFTGTHYFDVTALTAQNPCFHPAHPLNRKQASECRNQSFRAAREAFGASSSEGCLPYAVGALDYGLYMLWAPLPPHQSFGIFDHSVPLRFIAEHGLVHYNCYSTTVNAPLKDAPAAALLNLALGGQPCFYYYSKFRKNSPWGQKDLTANGPEDLAEGVEMIRKDYENFKKVRDLQLLFIQDIRQPIQDVMETLYEDGTITRFNSLPKPYTWEDGMVSAPLSLTRLNPDGTRCVLTAIPG